MKDLFIFFGKFLILFWIEGFREGVSIGRCGWEVRVIVGLEVWEVRCLYL